MNKAEEHINKGTTTVGIVCKEGIVLGADKRVTLGGAYVSHKSFDKVYKITENLAITTAGTVSDVQLITKLIISTSSEYEDTYNSFDSIRIHHRGLAHGSLFLVYPRVFSKRS